ncbi:methyl-accepting chemotaxis protein [Geomonas silvestris]|uniref:Methyl-accepting chemotaxis protein n=1 Tax=Geomonas silvestris TaxID=2740184 RepID=A0A6V8MN60_9BACT|nr:methyl-accepting chemotaxis protein [Geomonas silvestris]GFO61153.1 methyl-accepting chemotaxis protein [Geomonas silvestris]
MKNLSIGTRLFAGFTLVSLILVIVVGTGIKSLYTSADQLENVNRVSDLSANAAKVLMSIKEVNEAIKGLVLADTQAERDKLNARIEESRKSYKQALEFVVKNTKTPDGKKLLAELQQAIAAGVETNAKLKAATDAGDVMKFKALQASEGEQIQAKYTAAANALLDYFAKRVDLRVKTAREAGQSAIALMIGLGIFAVVLSILTSLVITRGVRNPLKEMTDSITAIAEGDLTRRVSYQSRDELGQLSEHFNKFAAKLQQIMVQLAGEACRVASASTELRSTAHLMAEGTEEVVAQAGTVATAGEEMAATSSDIAQNCHLAAEGAQRANQAALEGSGVVQTTVRVMGLIAERVQGAAQTVESLGSRSDQIGAIVGTIEDIADQTNLLALNAAIEAARAGEQGRGFAVVADEVRALAERTTRATKEISEMIRTIQSETRSAVSAMEEGNREVERGTQEAARSGHALEDILEQINAVTVQAQQIATAAEQQTATTSEISSNMMQITDIVQRAAQGAGETAEAAHGLAVMSEELQGIVNQFKVA